MNIDDAIDIVNELKKITQSFKVNCNLQDYEVPDALETLINEYNNLKQIEEAHRIENGELRKELEQEKEKNNMLKSKLKEHIKFCETESEGSLHNDICKKSLLFDKSLLKILKEE